MVFTITGILPQNEHMHSLDTEDSSSQSHVAKESNQVWLEPLLTFLGEFHTDQVLPSF